MLLDVLEARVWECSDGTVGGTGGATNACDSGAAESGRELARRASEEDDREVTASDEEDVEVSEPLWSFSQPSVDESSSCELLEEDRDDFWSRMPCEGFPEPA